MDIELLSQRFCDYLKYMRAYSPETIKRYRVLLRTLRNYTQEITIENITDAKMRDFFLHGRSVRKWQPRTFLIFYHSYKVFFRWCVQNGYTQVNPVTDIELPRVEKRLPRKLTNEDCVRLLEAVYNLPYNSKYERLRNHAVFSMFLLAGLRRGELLRLKFTDVDAERQTIFVSQGKGAKDRIIPMSHTLAERLRRYLDERKRLGKTCPEFFTSLVRNTPLTKISLKRIVIRVREASGITFSAHKLRHSFAMLMLEGGCDIYSLSRMMGHSEITTTAIYLSASAEHLRLQITKHPLNDHHV